MTTLVCNFIDIIGEPIDGVASLSTGDIRPDYTNRSVKVPHPVSETVVAGLATFDNVRPGKAVLTVHWDGRSATFRFTVPDAESITLVDAVAGEGLEQSELDEFRAGIAAEFRNTRNAVIEAAASASNDAATAQQAATSAAESAEEASEAVSTAASGAIQEVHDAVAADRALIEGYKDDAAGSATTAQQAATTAAADAVAEASSAISASVQRAETAAGEAEASVAVVTGIVSDAAATAVTAVQAELDEDIAQAEAAATRAAEHEAGAAAAASAEVNKLKGEAPEAFDTLGEIAAELAANDTERAALASLIAGKADKEHTHTAEEVDGLDTALAGKSDTGHRHTWEQVDDKPATFPPTTGTTPDTAAPGDHTHTPESIGAAPAGHTHSEYATTTQVNARTPEIRIVSSPEMATSPGALYVVRED